jgi:hypothetical protein
MNNQVDIFDNIDHFEFILGEVMLIGILAIVLMFCAIMAGQEARMWALWGVGRDLQRANNNMYVIFGHILCMLSCSYYGYYYAISKQQ